MNLVLDLTKYLSDFVLDDVRAGGLLLETVQIGEQLAAYKVPQAIAT